MATLDLFACFILFLKLILFLFRVTYNCQNVCMDRYDLILSLNNNQNVQGQLLEVQGHFYFETQILQKILNFSIFCYQF